MDNRLTTKDITLITLMVIVLIVMVLGIVQYDRQWRDVRALQSKIDDQSQTLNQLAEMIQRGVKVNGAEDGRSDLDKTTFERRLAPRRNKDFAKGGWFIDAFGTAVSKLTPLVSSDVYQATIASHVLETLAVRDPDTLEWQPWIAKSWSISEDGLTYTFKLRHDVTFSDGSPLTAKDVVFTYHWIMNPKIAAPRDRAYYSRIDSVEESGKYEVVFRFKEPYFLAMSLCGGMQVFSRKYYSQFTPDQFNSSTGLLFGSGPYKLAGDPKDWSPGSGQIELVRNARYWGVKPALDRLMWREITDESARLAAFRNGEIGRYGVQPEQYDTLKDDPGLNKKADLYEYRTIAGGYRYIGWNQQRDGKPTPFADRRVRLALTLLTNRPQMAQRLMAGLATVATGPFHPLGHQDDPNVKPWPYAPEKARELLKEAGYVDRDGDGVREGPQGRPLRFKLIYPSSSANYKQMAGYLKDAYARAGIAMRPDPLEFSIMIQRINDRDFDAMTLGWGGSIESDPYQMFDSSQIKEGGDNYISYKNPKLDKLIETARITIDQDKRTQMWHQVHAILHHDQPYTFLFNTKAVMFVDKRLHNVTVTKTGLSDPEQWYVPTTMQKYR